MEYTPRRKLTREFKLEAVRQVALSEKPKAQLADGRCCVDRLSPQPIADVRERVTCADGFGG